MERCQLQSKWPKMTDMEKIISPYTIQGIQIGVYRIPSSGEIVIDAETLRAILAVTGLDQDVDVLAFGRWLMQLKGQPA